MTNKELGLHVYGARTFDHDINNIYGYNNFAFPQELEGYYVWYFTQTQENNFEPYDMSEKRGKVTVNGKEVPFLYFRRNFGWNPWHVAVDIRKLHFVPGESYTITISDFETKSGEKMEAVDTVINCIPQSRGEEKDREHNEKTVVTARESAVLLKNDNKVLPIKNKKINIFGDAYYRFYNMSGGAGCINPKYSIGFSDGLTEYGNFSLNPELVEFFAGETFNYNPSKEEIEKAKNYSDVAVITIGRGSKEDTDNNPNKGGYYLTDEEEKLIADVSSVFENTVAVLNVGYPIDVKWVEKYNIKGLLWYGYCGQSAGQVLGEILNGEVTPSGHLPDTWALDYWDYPSAKNYVLNSDIPKKKQNPLIVNAYEEGIYVGYKYFDTFNVPVAYPFGHGLSYTAFKQEFLSASYENGLLKIRVQVENVGECSGKQVVQIYGSEPDGKLEKCAHKLIGFEKTKLLKKGEKEILEIVAYDRELSSFCEEIACTIMEKGTYKIFIGENVNELTEIYSFTLNEDKIIEKLHNYCSPKKKIRELSKFTEKGVITGENTYFDVENDAFDFSKTKRKQFSVPKTEEYHGDIIYYEDVEKNPDLLDDFVCQMSVEELARVSVCAQAWAIDANGVAGSVFPIEKYKMKHFYTADGNTTVRMHKRKTGFPCSNMVCASFNREMSYIVGRVIAQEAHEEKIHIIEAPGMNLHRNPLCGRHPEYFSEDPYLCGIMAGHFAKGLQDNKIGACLKHVIANNNEISRYRTNSVMNERTLREIYARCFEVAMSVEMPDCIMTAYNAMNDCYTGMDEELMQGIFREELGFTGYIVTDWDSYRTCDPVKAVAAGNCWLTPGTKDDTYTKPIVDGVKNGIVDIDRLRDNVKHHVAIMIKYTSVEKN